MPVRLLIAEKQPEIRQQILDMAIAPEQYELAGCARDGQETIELAMTLSPDIVIVADDIPGINSLQTCEILSTIAPNVLTVIASDAKTVERMDIAMRAGARAFITKPIDPRQFATMTGLLEDLRSRMKSDEYMEWNDSSRYPKILTVTGAKGGVGKTSVAVNLAVSLAKHLPEKVALLDMCTQFGDVATMMNIAPRNTIVDMVAHTRELESDVVQSYMTKHASGVHVLITTATPVPYDAISAQCMENLLYILRRLYRYVVIDIPPMLNPASLQLLSRSNYVILVANLWDLATIAGTKTLYDTLVAENISKKVIKVALNRVSRSNAVQMGDIAKILDCEILAEIPNDQRLVSSVNQGVPLMMNDIDTPFARSFDQIAATLMGKEPDEVKPKKLTSILSNIFGGIFYMR